MSSGSEPGASLGDIVRSLAFYPVFWGGTVLYVLAATMLMPFSPAGLRAVVEAWSRYHRACARVLLGITVHREGEPMHGTVLYAIRHESFFEAIDLPELLHQPVIFAKAELIRLPLWGRAAQRYGVVPVARNEGARALRAMVAAAKSHAESGRPLAIFPEGTRMPAGSSPVLQSGFAGLYKLLGLPVVPVAVNSGRLYHRWWKRRGMVTYRFGETIPPGLPRQEIEARVKASIGHLLEPPADPPLQS